jgi:hypothetical protein
MLKFSLAPALAPAKAYSWKIYSQMLNVTAVMIVEKFNPS